MATTPAAGVAPLRLSELLGRRVHLADGRWGRVRDLVVDLAEVSALVTGVVLRQGRKRLRAPWSAVTFTTGHLFVDLPVTPPDLTEHEVLLGRDVLDTVVFDGRLRSDARVGEVWLGMRPDGNLELLGVQTGLAPVWQRLTAHHGPPGEGRVVALSQLHLTSPRGHAVQLGLPHSWVGSAPHSGLGDLLTRLPVERAIEAVERLPAARVAAAAATMHPHPRGRLGRALRGPSRGERRRTRRTRGWRSYHPGTQDR